MIKDITDADSYVYHYTSAATAEKHILKDFTLKISSYLTTNDPKETKAWTFDLGTTSENYDLDSYNALRTDFSDELKSRTKLVSFTTDRRPLSGDPMGDIYRRGYVKARMWAQYGGNHTGVCIAFHRDRLLAAIQRHFGHHEIFSGQMRYLDAALVRGLERHEFSLDVDRYEALGLSSYVRWHIQQHHQRLFFEKLEDWRDESEWRILVMSDDASPLFLPIADSIVAVIHGDSTDPDCSERLMALTKGRDVEHLGISWKNSSPWYDFSFDWEPGKVTRPRRIVSRAGLVPRSIHLAKARFARLCRFPGWRGLG